MKLTIEKIIKDELVYPVYQPIFSLDSGIVLGYDSFIRGPKESNFHSPHILFKTSKVNNLLQEMDSLSRKIICKTYSDSKKLFFNVDSIIYKDVNSRIEEITTSKPPDRKLAIVFPQDEHIDFEDIVRETNYVVNSTCDLVLHYDSINPTNLNRMLQINPDYVKLSKKFIKGVLENDFKRTVLKAFVNVAREHAIKTIADGIDSAEILEFLIQIGVDYGQGKLLSEKQVHIKNDYSNTANIIKEINLANTLNSDLHKLSITKIINPYPTFQKDDLIEKADKYFVEDKSYRSIPILNELRQPVGQITRYHLNMILSRRFGRDVFLKKTIHSIMDKIPLIVSSKLTITEVAVKAMSRNVDRVYQDIIVKDFDTNEYLGVVTVKDIVEFQIKMNQDK